MNCGFLHDKTKNELIYTTQKKLKMLDGAGPQTSLTFQSKYRRQWTCDSFK